MVNSRNIPVFAFVVPCYNEFDMFPYALEQLKENLNKLIADGEVDSSSFLYFVDDGSNDGTWDLIAKAHEADDRVRGLKLAKNAGHQNALRAGMITLSEEVDCLISLDADLQDDISVVSEMIDHYMAGCEIVYGVRKSRDNDSLFKRETALSFYKLCGLLGLEIKPDHADYRLVSKRALSVFAEYKEDNIFLRGIFPAMGFKTADVFYERKRREHGETKYPLCKMLSFAWNGISSFSVAPLRLSGVLGLIMLIPAFLYLCFALLQYTQGVTVPGWTSLVVAVFFMGSVQLICLSIIGEYVGKTYMAVKERPTYIVEKEI